MPKKSKRTPKPKVKPIPAFNKSRARNYPVETDKTTPNPTQARRVQDLGSTGINKSKAIGLVFDASDMRGRSDKGKKRGPNTGRSRRLSVQELPSNLYRVSEGRQEGVRGVAGGVRQYGHTLRTSIPDTPVGGWGGLDPNQFDTRSAESERRSRRSGTGSSNLTRASLESDVEKGRSDLRVKVIKLDAPENDPKNFSDAKLDELVITRIQRKRGISGDEAESKFLAMTEQAKNKLREEERRSLILEREKQKKRVESDIDRLADTQAELEQVIEEDESAISGVGSMGAESIKERKARILKAKIQLMREFGQVDSETLEGKFKLAQLIDEQVAEGQLIDAERDALLREQEALRQPVPEPEPVAPVVAVQPSGPLTSRPAVLRIKDAFGVGAKAVKDFPVSKGIVRELGGISETASNLAGAVREAELSRRGRAQAEQERIRLGSRLKEQFGEDAERLNEAIEKKFPTKPEEEGLNKQIQDRYYGAIKEAELTRKAREQAIKTRKADEKLNRELDRAERLKRFRERNRYGTEQSFINKRIEQDTKRTRELKPVVDDFIDDVIEDALGLVFPGQERQEREKRVAVKQKQSRRDPAEIYSGINPQAVGNIADKERQDLDRLRQSRRNATAQAEKRAKTSFLEKKLKAEDPKFMSDDDLEAKAKAVSQRIRDEERRNQDLLERGTINEVAVRREATRTQRPVLRLRKTEPTPTPEPEPIPEPEPVARDDDDDEFEDVDEFEDALDFTPAQLERYADADHFGNQGLTQERVKTIAEMEADLRSAQNRAENERRNYYRKLAEKRGPEPPPRPPTAEEEFLAGIDDRPQPGPPPPLPPRGIGIQTDPPLPPRGQLKFPSTEEVVRRVRQDLEKVSPQKPSQQRYARSEGAFLPTDERKELKVIEQELSGLKEYLDKYGFPRGLLGTSSKADRERKDKTIAIKLSQLRNNQDYDQIQRAIARTIELNKRKQKLKVKDSQLKKKKK